MTERFVTIDQYQFLPEADAVRIHMLAEGLTAQLADAETVSTDWALGNAIGYIKLQVPESQVEKARRMPGELRARRKAREEAPVDTTDAGRCLACDAKLQPDQATCPDCGWSYADAEGEESTDSEDALPAPSAEKPESVMDNLRDLKGLLVLMLLAPILGGILLFIGWLIHSLFGE